MSSPTPNGQGSVDPAEAQRQELFRRVTAPRPVPVGYSLVAERFVPPPESGKEPVYYGCETIHSLNGVFTLYWDIEACKSRAKTYRAMAAQLDQWRSGLWTPPSAGQGPQIFVPGQ